MPPSTRNYFFHGALIRTYTVVCLSVIMHKTLNFVQQKECTMQSMCVIFLDRVYSCSSAPYQILTLDIQEVALFLLHFLSGCMMRMGIFTYNNYVLASVSWSVGTHTCTSLCIKFNYKFSLIKKYIVILPQLRIWC